MSKLYSTGALSLAAMAMFAASKAAGAEAPPAPTPVNASGYAFEAFEIPTAARAVGGATGEPNPLMVALAEVPVGMSFLEKVEVPAAITDPEEREKEFKALVRKLTNRVSGAIRRHRDSKDNTAYAAHNFQLRTVHDDKLGHGVRVWRVADSTPEELAAKAAEAARAAEATKAAEAAKAAAEAAAKVAADAAQAAANAAAAVAPPPPPPPAS